ncbi:MAG: SusC/RagA family TonB-linked outer membrane protein, partial [Dysgonamonadaceae bacterium]|nr:SusC/RagA family TonB-linked outer membrane protein [Dysgonamonadaceae bacterium]
FYGSKRVGIYRGNNQIETANGEIIQADDATMIIPANVGERVVYKAAEIIGKGLPDWMGGFANAFHYKGFDLSIDLQFSLGGDVMQEFFHTTEARFLTNLLEKGMSQDVRLNNFGQGANNEADDTWVANGSYLRVNLISLGYTFSPKSLTKANLSALRLYANVNNAFLFTAADYLGYDPGASSHVDSNWGTNRQFFVYPTPRTITLGLNITF